MTQEAIGMFYDKWTETNGYWKESSVENDFFKKCKENIIEEIGAEAYGKASDEIRNYACGSEISGFEYGFRYGVMFMSSIINGGMMNEK